ncbi:hypothetical protein D3C85_825090 [compost metagenome]
MLRVEAHRPGIGDGATDGGAGSTDQHGDQHRRGGQAPLLVQPEHHQPGQGDQAQACDDLRGAFQVAMQNARNNPAEYISRAIQQQRPGELIGGKVQVLHENDR